VSSPLRHRGAKSRTDRRNSRQKSPTATASSGSDTATTNGEVSLVHLKRRISDKKWKEVHEWFLARTKSRRFDVRRRGKAADPAPAKAPKRARFYQLKSGQALMATHMKKIKDDQCWWCFRSKQTREHLFKHCSTWQSQQNAMWALVATETKCRKRRWKMVELFADERCSESILEFLRTTDVGRMVPPPRADSESEASAADPECPRDGCGCDPRATGVVARDLGRKVLEPPAAFGLEFRGGKRAELACSALIFFFFNWYAVAPHRADPGAFAAVDQSGQERQCVWCAFAIV